jgi:hypothetical protein
MDTPCSCRRGQPTTQALAGACCVSSPLTYEIGVVSRTYGTRSDTPAGSVRIAPIRALSQF